MNGAAAALVAVTFLWLGMVAAISFLEAPLKFRAPGVTLRVGLGIGRLVFRALNSVEIVLAAATVLLLWFAQLGTALSTCALAAVLSLAAQLLVVRPRLSRRTDLVLAGNDTDRSRIHLAYIGLEVVKAMGLAGSGVWLLVRMVA